MTVIYYSGIKEENRSARLEADNNIRKYIKYENIIFENIEKEVFRLSNTEDFRFSNKRSIENNLSSFKLGVSSTYFDFIEIIDSAKIVLASKNRPALIGTKLSYLNSIILDSIVVTTKQIEFDRQGGHATYGIIHPLGSNRYMYAGKFIGNTTISIIQSLMDAEIELVSMESDDLYSRMELLKLYESKDSYISVLQSSEVENYYLIARFNNKHEQPILQSLFITTAIVSFFSILMAIVIGIFITGKNKSEMENLIRATEQIAKGDFTTPVMAYREGQYSQLADSFTDMMTRLKKLQHKLSTTEKIAAWQMIGRKIAHELKNPLTPISISIDDLKMAYDEKLPDFDKTFRETSDTIKKEVVRINELINEFVSFARMKSANPKPLKAIILFNDLRAIYTNKINSDKLKINFDNENLIMPLDMSLMKQVLINLIKNGFESATDSHVVLNTKIDNKQLIITIEDNGPGFTNEKLKNSFEPFVTTKSEGSGLGLVISHRIVNDHNGIMELYNNPDGGGIVKITLPI
jgi:nitrogen fixation/metabolism regulation signal transduction histidine kinase